MLEHVAAFFRKEQEETRYRAYITDALKALTENTTRYLIPGVGEVQTGTHMRARWYGAEQQPEEDTRSGDEVAEDVIRRIGLKLKGGD